MAYSPKSPKNIHFVTLGCPKNRVDSELMLGRLAESGMAFTMEPTDADIIVVNTCGFIEDAKRESVEVILEMAQHRTNGRAQQLVVAGCLVQRYAKELEEEIPEVDTFLGTGAYETINDVLSGIREPGQGISTPTFLHSSTAPRINTFLPHSTYVKVAEGCDQKCSFCIIPTLRGLQRSRPITDIVREAEALAARGVVEFNLVAQDLTGYGYDQNPRTNLANLLEALAAIDSLRWVRVHYLYPRPFSKALLRVLSEANNIVPYIDMPLQHIADPVLKRMNRGRPRRFVEKLLKDIRSTMPNNLTLRTSFIVGFPGETDQDFQELCTFVQEQQFDRVGIFKFSREENTPSYDLPDQVPEEVAEERHNILANLLRESSRDKQAEFLGRRLEVLVDGVSSETELLLEGRHSGQAPEVDGTIYLNDGQELASAGDIVEVEITETHDYDLVGCIHRVIHPAPSRPAHARMDAPNAPALPTNQPRLRIID